MDSLAECVSVCVSGCRPMQMFVCVSAYVNVCVCVSSVICFCLCVNMKKLTCVCSVPAYNVPACVPLVYTFLFTHLKTYALPHLASWLFDTTPCFLSVKLNDSICMCVHCVDGCVQSQPE